MSKILIQDLSYVNPPEVNKKFTDLAPVFDALCIDNGARLREKVPCKDGTRWVSHKRRISYKDMADHFQGKRIIGHVCQGHVDCISRDIDAHGLLPGVAEKIITEIYNRLCSAHGKPSLVVRTSTGGGLHCYWFLTERVPYDTLSARLKEMVPDVEILPIPRTAESAGKIIRSPFCYRAGGHGLDPDTLKPLPIKTGDIAATAMAVMDASLERVSLERFLGLSKELARAVLRNCAKKKRRLNKGLRTSSYLLKSAQGITQGNTNDSILEMVRACRLSRFSRDETIDYISKALQSAPISLKDDTQGPRLEKRIKWLYKRCRTADKAAAARTMAPQPTLFTNEIADGIVKRIKDDFGIIGNRRLGTLKRFVHSLVNSVERVRELNTRERRLIDSVYRGFYYRTAVLKQVPLPAILFRSWARNYTWYVQALRRIGVLVPTWKGANGGYCPGGQGDHYREKEWGTCRFWQVNL